MQPLRFVSVSLLLPAVVGLLVSTGCNPESRKRRAVEVGNKYYDEGKYRQASLAYSRALQVDPRYGEAHYRLGLARIRTGLIPRAIQSLRRACELQPNNEDAHARLGDLYLAIFLSNPQRNQRQLLEFGELADSLLKRNSSSFEGLRLKGYQLLGQGKLEEAIQVFQEANRSKPGQDGVVLVLAQTLAGAGRFDEAETLTRKLLETNKTFGPAYDFLYGQYVGRNRPSEATEVLRLKVSNNPKQADFFLQLATHYMRNNEPRLMEETLALLSGNLKDFPNAYMQLGDYFYRLQQFPRARTYYDQGASLVKASSLAYRKKTVECLYAENRRDEAMRLVTDLLGAHKEDIELRALRAALRLQSRDPKEISTAVEELQAAVARIPENPVLRFRLGEGLAAKGEMEQARLQFEEAIKLRAGYMAPMHGLAGIYLAKNDFTRVSQIASEILTISPNDLNARLLRVNALLGLRDQTRARAELDLMLKANSKLPQALFLLAALDAAQRRFPQAEAGFRQLLELGDPRGFPGLVDIQLTQGRVAEARRMVQAELSRAPNNPSVRLLLARIAERAGDHEVMIAEINGLVAKSPESADLFMMLGRAYRIAGKSPEAIEAFSKARQLKPGEIATNLNLALAYEAVGDRVKAKPLYEQVLNLAPDNPIALNNLAYTLAETGGDLEVALKYAQRAKQKYPQDGDIADTLGWIYIRKNLSENAIRIFQDLVRQNPAHVTWRYHLAMALFQKGDKPNAKRELEAALKNKPTREEEGRIRELLAKTGP